MSDGHEEAAEGGASRDEEVGSLTDETLKLFGALFDQSEGSAFGASSWADRAAAAAHDLNDHIATGSAECRVCPVCRVIHAFRETSPEVRAHLRVAGGALLEAAAGVLASAPDLKEQHDARRREARPEPGDEDDRSDA
ncbi:MAG: hypothetical protein V9G04_05445 [Nocardioides sp.]